MPYTEEPDPPADEEEASTGSQMTLPPPLSLAKDMDKADNSSSDDGMDTQHSRQKLMNPNDLEEPFTNAEEEEIVE